MKKHQALIISLIFILAKIAAIVIIVSKKSTEVTSTTTTELVESTPIVEQAASNQPVVTSPAKPATYTMTEVATHNSRESCYTVISGSVYDVTAWISKHPGGQFAILGLCGKDGTDAFTGKHGGQARPESELASFKIGTLVQ